MPIELPKGLPFSVDTWTPSSNRKKHHFLTHAHKDHSQGISAHFSYPIYATHLTKTLTLQHYPQLDESLFVGIEVEQSVVIDDPDGAFLVTAFDANHCPGDCRLTPECLQSLPEKYLGKKAKEPRCRLDYVFLDCTFGRFSLKMPSKHSAIRQVINCIWKHPGAPVVYLTCDLLGQEDILVNVGRTFGSRIFIDKERNPECYQSLTLTVPEILSQDSTSRFRMFDGFPKLYERSEAKVAEARANFQPEPLIIRPSAQWYACEEGSMSRKQGKERFNEAVRDQFGVWHVCYSMHSSREELEWALQLLTTPSCRAMELDYVKKHFFNTQLASGDLLWKLLDISVEASPSADVSMKGSIYSPLVETCAEPQSQPAKIPTSQSELLNLSPPSKRPAVTLFGRARLGLQESTFLQDEKQSASINDDNPHTFYKRLEQSISLQKEDVKEECQKSLDIKKAVDIIETKCKSVEIKTETCEQASYSPIGPSKSYDEKMRKFYRTMNVPVPRPLPSLAELMNSKKHAQEEV